MDNPAQISLFDQPEEQETSLEHLQWPEQDRFPINLGQRRVDGAVLADLAEEGNPLIVTGYASLARVMDLVCVEKAGAVTRILFGAEPFGTSRSSFAVGEQPLPREAEAYWLARGISLRLSAKLLLTIEAIKSGQVQPRYLGTPYRPLHAKIYCGSQGVTLGSSNFTDAGLGRQLEANVRFTQKEKKRFQEAVRLAENYWSCGEDYSEQLISLLERLLKVVTWQEALARACAEILEGQWAKEYLATQSLPGDMPLWPSQVEGIAQVLWLLENVGSALVADATGSGKTRMGAHLIRSALDRIWRSGRVRKGGSVLLVPPAVVTDWARESTKVGAPVAIMSHGSLSHALGEKRDDITEAVRRAQILAVDEAHNFLNLHSKRTQLMLGNMADHNVLFTATPINRGITDLLRLVDALGADNLEPSTLGMFERLLRGRGRLQRTFSENELRALRREIQRFTVRRTKRMLNDLVDRDPEAFKDRSGRPCRYPRHESRTYSLMESDHDRGLAKRIRLMAAELSGVALFVQEVEMPEVLREEGWSEEKYLSMRLHAAKKLSEYLVMSSLRSSAAALIEHVAGTAVALERFGLPRGDKKQTTGDFLTKLSSMAGRPPRTTLSIEVPVWMTDAEAHQTLCERERKVYQAILNLATELQGSREKAKVDKLVAISESHEMCIAFDSRPITIALLHSRLAVEVGPERVLMATGENVVGKKKVLEALKVGGTTRKLIALCSDTMSEGVNLQQASAVVHLDMPSVVRIAEQRVGRVDRMDSPHSVIEAWWPDDAPEFGLKADERFIERYGTVDALLGSNLPLPEGMTQDGASSALVGASEMIASFEEAEKAPPWDGIQDAFAPVRDLVQGEAALVPVATYGHYRDVKSRVISRIGLVRAASPWAFFCIAGTAIGAPRWMLVRNLGDAPVTDLLLIEEELRVRLGENPENLPMTSAAGAILDKFLMAISLGERSLIARRKQRALDEMTFVMERYRNREASVRNQEGVEFLSRLLEVLQNPTVDRLPDWDAVAERWLDLIRPIWYEKLLKRRRHRPLVLKDIRADLLGERALTMEQIVEAFHEVPRVPPVDQRVVACILGVAQ